MSVKRRLNVVSQMRLNVPEVRALESSVSNDFDELLQTLVLGESQSLVVRGFEINMASAIGSSANGLQMIVASSAMLHGKSSVSGTFFNISSTEPNQILDSSTNPNVSGSFTPGALNYVGVELVRSVDDTTLGPVYLWNPSNNTETTKVLPLAQTLKYQIVISSSSFASNVLPIAVIKTNTANNVEKVDDRRPMLFRLGVAGAATPNPFYSYPWSNDAEGREENYFSSSSSTSPFKGGDKQIKNLKEYIDAISSSIKEIKGTSYWYQKGSQGSLTKLRQDLAHTVISGRGLIAHDNSVAGKINWSQDVFVNFIGGNLRYNLKANASSSYITLADNQVAYIKLVREVDITPSLVFTNNSPTVYSVGSIAWTNNVQVGDFIKLASKDETKYYEIQSIDSQSQVTLTSNYNELSTGNDGDKAQYAYGFYEAVSSPSTDRHIKIANRNSVPFDQNTYWLFFRNDNGGSLPLIYIRFTETELQQGETQYINNGFPNQVLEYLGSPSETSTTPDYNTNATGTINLPNYNSTNGVNITNRVAEISSMMADKAQDKTIKYAENYTSIFNSTNSTNQRVWFQATSTPTVDIILPSSLNFKNTITLTGYLDLAVNEAAVFVIDRNNPFSATLSTLTKYAIGSVPLDENTFIFAYRLDDSFVYLYNNRRLKLGGNPLNSGAGVIKVNYYDPASTSTSLGSVTIDGNAIADQDRVLFSNLSSGNNSIYTATVVSGLVTDWRIEYDFSGNNSPSDGDFVVVESGTLFADQLGKFNGTSWVFNDKVRYFNGTDYFEQSNLCTSTINNNQTSAATLTSYNFSGSEYAIVEYSINRGTARESGQLIIATDGIDVAMSQNIASLSDVGVHLFADISGSEIRIRYTSESLGSGGVFKFNMRRWSNSSGGPSGIPSYTGNTSSTGNVTASGANANGQIAYFTGSNDVTSNGGFKIDPANGSINLNGLEQTILVSSTLFDAQSSPTVLMSYDTSHTFAIVEYSLTRGASVRMGRFMICHDGSVPEISEDYIQKGDTETLFTADISGPNVRLLYVSSSNGNNGTFKYSVRRWN